MKRSIIVFIIAIIPTLAFSEIIQLNSGETIEGKILSRTTEQIKVDRGSGIIVTYFLDEVAYTSPNFSESRISKTYYPSGTLQSETELFKEEIVSVKEYYESDGIQSEVKFVEGKRTFEKNYTPDGVLEAETSYQNDKPINEKIYYPNGKLAQELNFAQDSNSDEVLHGIIKEFSSNGNIKKETNYNMGEKSGEESFYSAEGSIQSSFLFNNGLLDGNTIFFDKKGEPITKILFKNGQIIKIKVLNKNYAK